MKTPLQTINSHPVQKINSSLLLGDGPSFQAIIDNIIFLKRPYNGTLCKDKKKDQTDEDSIKKSNTED